MARLPTAILTAVAGSAALVALFPAGAVPPLPEPPAAPQGDWTRLVVETPEGGFRMGNPDARVKLVQYTSLSCAHCAKFETDGVPELRALYVAAGQVSWEVRTYPLFATDTAASLLLRCRGPAQFFPLAAELYSAQADWTGRYAALAPDRVIEILSLAPADNVRATAEATGLDLFFRKRGMSDSEVRECLIDPAGAEKLAAIAARGNWDGIMGTPTFILDGVLLDDAFDWKALEPRLRAALR